MQKKIYTTVFVILLFTAIAGCGQKEIARPVDAPTWQEQYDLGVRYLSDGNYKEAILAFTAAIEIDPSQLELYIRRADAYVSLIQATGFVDGNDVNYICAEQDYLRALDIDEKNIDAYIKLSDLYYLAGDVRAIGRIFSSATENIAGSNPVEEHIVELIFNLRWFSEEFINCDELTLGGVPFYELDIYDLLDIFPSIDSHDDVRKTSEGLSYTPHERIETDDGHVKEVGGHLLFDQYSEDKTLTVACFRDSLVNTGRQLEFRGVEIGEPFQNTLKKIGLTDVAIYSILNLYNEIGSAYGSNVAGFVPDEIWHILLYDTNVRAFHCFYYGNGDVEIRIIWANSVCLSIRSDGDGILDTVSFGQRGISMA